MSNENKKSVFAENMATLITPEGIQKYILGSKKNGTPRAIYDIVKDYVNPGKKKKGKGGKKKKKKADMTSTYAFYLNSKSGKKKKKKKNKYWHI